MGGRNTRNTDSSGVPEKSGSLQAGRIQDDLRHFAGQKSKGNTQRLMGVSKAYSTQLEGMDSYCQNWGTIWTLNKNIWLWLIAERGDF